MSTSNLKVLFWGEKTIFFQFVGSAFKNSLSDLTGYSHLFFIKKGATVLTISQLSMYGFGDRAGLHGLVESWVHLCRHGWLRLPYASYFTHHKCCWLLINFHFLLHGNFTGYLAFVFFICTFYYKVTGYVLCLISSCVHCGKTNFIKPSCDLRCRLALV